MKKLLLISAGVATVVFGPAVALQATAGYAVGACVGIYTKNRMKDLHVAICEHTGDDVHNIDQLADYAEKASRIGGLLCPIIPVVSLGVGIYCSNKAKKIQSLPNTNSNQEFSQVKI